MQIVYNFTFPPVLNLLLWYHLFAYILVMYYRKQNQCCNLIDHIGLPIIHINTDIHNRDKRQEHVSRIIDYIIVKGSIQYKELK